MLIVDQARECAYDAADFREIQIKEERALINNKEVMTGWSIVGIWRDRMVSRKLGTYESLEETKEALMHLALAWENAKCYFMT